MAVHEVDPDRAPFWWCRDHERVEDDSTTCRAKDRYGPYESPAAARDWMSRFEQREDDWEEQDEAWDGEDSDPDAD